MHARKTKPPPVSSCHRTLLWKRPGRAAREEIMPMEEPDVMNVPEIMEDDATRPLTAGDVLALMEETRKERLRIRKEEAASDFRSTLNRSSRIALLVYVDGRCIGKKTASLWEAQGEDGIAVRLYERYGGKEHVRIVAAIGRECLLVSPDDGSLIKDAGHFEEHPEEYGPARKR